MGKPKLMLVEAAGFTPNVVAYFGDDDGYAAFQSYLASNPEAGDVMPSCGGLRKMRWANPQRGMGKRGGLRIIYLYVPLADRILLVDMYHKGEAEDLTPSERRVLAQLAEEYRRQVLTESGSGGNATRH
jgi:hypothetical protein